MFTLDEWKTVAEAGAALIAAASLLVAVSTFRQNAKLSRIQWTASLAQEFLLNPKYERVRFQLQMNYTKGLDPFFQATSAGERAADFCSKKEISQGRAAADFLMHLELFCYLEHIGTLKRSDVDAMLGYWFDYFQHPDLLAMRVFLQELGFEYISERMALKIPVNRIAVYGTLKPGSSPVEGRPNLDSDRLLGEVDIPGRLYDTGSGFPVAVLSKPGKRNARFVRAQVIELAGDAAAVKERLRELDEYESTSPLPGYRRVIINSALGPVWFYDFTGEVSGLRELVSGEWPVG